MKIRFWLTRPRLLWARIKYWRWEKANPDKPWLVPEAVAFLDRTLTTDMTGIEFGSGRSTAWFASKSRHLVSIEHNAEWYARVKENLARLGRSNVDYRCIPLDSPDDIHEKAHYDPLPKYVAVLDEFPDDSFDFAVIDGSYRSFCINAVMKKLKPGGLLVIDNANYWPTPRPGKPPVPDEWEEVHRSDNLLDRTVVYRKPGGKG